MEDFRGGRPPPASKNGGALLPGQAGAAAVPEFGNHGVHVSKGGGRLASSPPPPRKYPMMTPIRAVSKQSGSVPESIDSARRPDHATGARNRRNRDDRSTGPYLARAIRLGAPVRWLSPFVFWGLPSVTCSPRCNVCARARGTSFSGAVTRSYHH
jgi:hypothetical protein